MKSLSLLLAAGAFGLACDSAPVTPRDDPPQPSFSAFHFKENTFTPIDFWFFVPCANGGAGEDVHLIGTIVERFRAVSPSSGKFLLFNQHIEFRNVSGTGTITGDKYRDVGGNQSHDFFTGVGQTSTLVENFHVVGPGPGSNFALHFNIHATFNPDGTTTITADNFKTDCR